MPEDDLITYKGVRLKRHGKRWRWELRHNGARVRPTFDTLEAAIDALDRFLVRRDIDELRGERAAAKPITISELLDRWFLWKAAELAPATVKQYGIHMRVHITPAIGDADANTIRPWELEAFYRSLRWKPAKESHHILRQAFDWGLRNEQIVREANLCLVARPNKRSSIDHDGFYDTEGTRPIDEKEIPTFVEVQKLLVDAEAGEPRWWLYLKLAATTGARPGELCALQRRNIDRERCTIRIEWTADRVGGKLKRPKTPWSIRTIPLPRAFLEEIAHALPEDPDAFLFPSNTRPGAVSPLPCWNSRGVKRRLDAAIKRTGIKHVTPHAFRHYAATSLLAEGRSPQQVARFLGHKDDREVRARYANHIVDEEQRRIGEAAARLT